MSKKSLLGRILLTGASVAAIASPAFAQEASDEIVVTATGRSAAIQDVPIAVTAVPGETLENSGVENLLDVQQLAPSLRIGSGQSTSLGTVARIRGMGTGGDNPGFESAVGFFIDGVYRARAGIAISDLPELERVEVLRGPQGTLFGRNTAAGAISIFTAQPEFEPGMWIEATGGNLNYGNMRAGANIPVSENMAIRLDGAVRARDGFMEDALTGEDYNTLDRWSLRGQMLVDLSDSASLRIIADTTSTDEDCCAATIARYGASAQPVMDGTYRFAAFWDINGADPAPGAPCPMPGQPGYADCVRDDLAPILYAAFPGTNTLPNTGGVVDVSRRQTLVSSNRDYLEQVDDGGISGELNWDLGGVNLTSVTAYREWEALRGQDIDYNAVDLFYRDGLETTIENFTQEIRLQGEFGRVNWIIGGFYGNEKLDTTDRIRFGPAGTGYINANIMSATAQAYAGGLLPAIFEVFDSTAGDADGVSDPVPSIFALFGSPGQYLSPIAAGQGQQADNWTIDTTDMSVFTHNEISLSDQLIWTIGLRYSHQEKDLTGVLDATLSPCTSLQSLQTTDSLTTDIITAANTPGPLQTLARGVFSAISLACAPQSNTIANRGAANPWTGDREENEWSGTTSLAYHLSDDLMIYGGYSRGYKAGGFNADRSGFTGLFPGLNTQAALNTSQLEYEPEFVDSFEVGFRSTIFGGSTYLNATVFHQTLSDYQLNAFNGTAFITRNIPEAISQGVEVDFLARLTPNLSIQGGVNYLDAYNNSTVAFVAGSAADTVQEGTPLVQAPEWSGTVAVTYEIPISDAFAALFYIDARYDSEYRTQALGRDPISDQQATTIMNARIALFNPDRHWAVEFWGRNITDELVWGGFNVPLQTGSIGAFTNEPQTYGVTVRARY